MADAASFSYADASIGTDTLCFSIVYYQHTVLCKVLSDSSKRY